MRGAGKAARQQLAGWLPLWPPPHPPMSLLAHTPPKPSGGGKATWKIKVMGCDQKLLWFPGQERPL